MKRNSLSRLPHFPANVRRLAALALFLAFLCALPAAAEPGAVPLTLGEETTAAVPAGETGAGFSFTPAQSGTYTFTSLGNGDTYATLLGPDGAVITSDDDSGDGQNFLITCELTAGESYCFRAKFFDGSAGTMRVLLDLFDFTWTLENGVLTITGTSPMPDYLEAEAPWFAQSDDIVSVVVGDGIPSIGTNAFFYCTQMTSAVIADSVRQIGAGAFLGCGSLSSVTMPEDVHFTWWNVLEECTSLADADGFVIIGQTLYGYTGYDQDITVPAGVRKIGDYAFYQHTALESAVLPEGLTDIGDFAFAMCDGLIDITIPSTVTSVSPSAFIGCSLQEEEGFIILQNVLYRYTGDETDVVIPDGVTAIGMNAFSDCDTVVRVTFPESLTRIAASAFRDCRALTAVTGPAGVQETEHYYYDAAGLREFTLPGTITEIGRNAFAGTSMGRLLEPDFVIPDSEADRLIIEDEAFARTGAVYAVIPSCVERINSRTFAGCTRLRYIYFSNSDCEIAGDAFEDCAAGLVIIARQESGASSRVSRYAADNGYLFVADENVIARSAPQER